MKRVGKEFFLQHDIVIMYSILFVFIIILKMQFFTWIGMFACLFGIVFYTLNEYMTHRFLFHLKPPKNVFLLKMLRRLHYDHHVYPDDLKLLFLPVWFSIPSFTIYLLMSYAKQHILHHYKNEKFWFGVSNPVFDFIFGTLKDGKDVELSETARNLEKEKKTEVVR
ncbi:fatty acid hydroxylase [Bacillus sp. BPN334]|uniref:fatty acid hydroxylase n=1 Tax=Bacillus sp. BPN334 TaxID=2217815 RepID=UPI0011EBA19C|nr:fatty acid hydroxylase [Bacillus sp. BPN334]KAA0782222.1 fatty acid hydroxylase [Bacillus sp. BPN334]